jgi:hypothetical protein
MSPVNRIKCAIPSEQGSLYDNRILFYFTAFDIIFIYSQPAPSRVGRKFFKYFLQREKYFFLLFLFFKSSTHSRVVREIGLFWVLWTKKKKLGLVIYTCVYWAIDVYDCAHVCYNFS